MVASVCGCHPEYKVWWRTKYVQSSYPSSTKNTVHLTIPSVLESGAGNRRHLRVFSAIIIRMEAHAVTLSVSLYKAMLIGGSASN
jgi:hypothetical protein